MRTIKFRAWATHQNKMYFPCELSNDGMALDMNGKGLANIHGGDNRLSEYDEGRLFIIEQYTGLKDIDDKEIYEGDVFQHPDGTKFFIKWDQGHCSFRANYYDDNLTSLLISQLDKTKGGAKYIGTIHDKDKS